MQLIAKHLDLDRVEGVEKCDARCAFTGERITRGVSKKVAVKSTFTDFEAMRYPSDYVSVEAAALLANDLIPGHRGARIGLRNFSFVANEDELRILRRDEILATLLDPPPPPFSFVVTYGGQKHVSYRATIEFNRDRYTVHTDEGRVRFIREEAETMLEVMRRWYRVIPEKAATATKPTYFTKAEIAAGSKNFKRIAEYPNDYYAENERLEKWRRSPLFRLVLFTLQKTGENQ